MNTLRNNEQNGKEIENNYTVYMHESPSGKKYVGITKTSLKKRWGSGHGYKNNPYFWSAIQKYGWKNIKHTVVAENLSKKEACELEINLINKMKLTDNKYGYNIRQGGNLPTAHLCKKVYMYDADNGNFIKFFNSIAEAEKYFNKPDYNGISRVCHENCYGTCFGYLWRTNYYPKIDVSDRNYWIVIFDRFTLQKIGCYYKSSHIPTSYNGNRIIPSKIVRVCNNQTYTYQNLICCYLKDYFEMLCVFKDTDFRAIYQIDKKQNIINVFSNYRIAEVSTNIKNIREACTHKYEQAGGYIWESVGYNGEDIYDKTIELENKYNFNKDVSDDESDSICAGVGYIKMFS